MQIEFRSPISVFLAVTARCNLHCRYCSANASPAASGEMTDQELAAVTDELLAARIRRVIVTGGEPLARGSLFALLNRLKQGRVLVVLNTNATLIDDAAAAELGRAGVHHINVSLDGVGAVNDATRGHGSWAKTTKGIAALARNGLMPNVLCTLTRRNRDRLGDLLEDCRRMGVTSVSVNVLAPQGRGATCADLTMEPVELKEMAGEIRRLKQQYGAMLGESFTHWLAYPQRLNDPRRDPTRVPRLLPCGAAKTFCAIQANGDVTPCNKFDGYIAGNLTGTPLADIWRSEMFRRVRQLAGMPVTAGATCGACDFQPVCAGGCRAEAYRAFGSLTAPDPACAILDRSAIHTSLDGCRPN